MRHGRLGRFPTRAHVILNRFELFDEDLLGTGSESSVYAMDEGHVLRIYRDAIPWDYVEARCVFLEELAKHPLAFAVPEIHSVGAWVGHIYTVETRMRGQVLANLLPTLRGDERAKVLVNFLDAAATLGTVQYSDRAYGQLMVDLHLQQESWQTYLRARLEQTLANSRADLEADVPEFDQVLAEIYQQMPLVGDHPPKCLVHGDFFPGNVYIGDDLSITGVGDFSYATIVGDARLDIAGAVWLLGAMEAAQREDSEFLRQQVAARWGDETVAVIDFYRLYYSIYFSGCKRDDPATYWWCVENLRRVHERVQ